MSILVVYVCMYVCMVCIYVSKNIWWKYTYFLKVGIFLGDLRMDTQLFPGANDSHSRSVERDRDVPTAISSLSPSIYSFFSTSHRQKL